MNETPVEPTTSTNIDQKNLGISGKIWLMTIFPTIWILGGVGIGALMGTAWQNQAVALVTVWAWLGMAAYAVCPIYCGFGLTKKLKGFGRFVSIAILAVLLLAFNLIASIAGCTQMITINFH